MGAAIAALTANGTSSPLLANSALVTVYIRHGLKNHGRNEAGTRDVPESHVHSLKYTYIWFLTVSISPARLFFVNNQYHEIRMKTLHCFAFPKRMCCLSNVAVTRKRMVLTMRSNRQTNRSMSWTTVNYQVLLTTVNHSWLDDNWTAYTKQPVRVQPLITNYSRLLQSC